MNSIKKLTYILYFIGNFMMLTYPGIFWDDWTLYNMSEKGIMNQFYGNGLFIAGYLHIFLQKLIYPPLLYHLSTIILQLFSIFILFKIVDKYKNKNSIFLYFAILIYSVLPLFDAKITMIVLPYTLCLTLFITATYFLIIFKFERTFIFKILSLILFFISFFTTSLVFFYLIPLLLIIFYDDLRYIIDHKIKKLKVVFNILINTLISHIDFILLPVIFWIVKILYFSPSFQYKESNYNEINLESFLEIPYRLIISIYLFFITLYPLLMELIQNLEFIILFIILSGFIFLKLGRLDLNFKSTKTKFLIGLLVCFIGLFPYILVGKYPTFTGYSSRHQLLLGFGISLLVVDLIFYISSKRLRNLILAMSLGLFVILNISIQFNYFKGFMKQAVVNDYLESQNLSRDFSQTILYKDNTSNFTHKGNPSNFYELSGILKLSHPDENIMLIKNEDFILYLQDGTFKKLTPYFFSYNLSNYNLVNPGLELEISYSKKPLPSFPLFVYYGDYLSGNKEKWMKYFEFNLKVL